MKIAILGATGHVGRSLATALHCHRDIHLVLYSRRGEYVSLSDVGLEDARVECRRTTDLDFVGCDIVVNAIGLGTPDKIAAAGASVIQLTLEWEERIKAALMATPSCLYVFISSGAVYGNLGEGPASARSVREFLVNGNSPDDAYGKAKFVAEALHRSWRHDRILDVRIFGYSSDCIDLRSGYLLSQMFASLLRKTCFVTKSDDIVRDYVGPKELSELILAAAKADRINEAVDMFSVAPVRKFELIEELKSLGLRYRVEEGATQSQAASRSNYYSTFSRARDFGYSPQRTAMEVVLDSARSIVRRAQEVSTYDRTHRSSQ